MCFKIPKTILDVGNDVSHDNVNNQLQILNILSYKKNDIRVDQSMHIFKSLNVISFFV